MFQSIAAVSVTVGVECPFISTNSHDHQLFVCGMQDNVLWTQSRLPSRSGNRLPAVAWTSADADDIDERPIERQQSGFQDVHSSSHMPAEPVQARRNPSRIQGKAGLSCQGTPMVDHLLRSQLRSLVT